MAITRYSQAVQQPQGLQPFALPFDQMYQVLANKQQGYDQASTALSQLNASFAGMTARLDPDQAYLQNKRKELDDFVGSLANQDLTKVPQLKQKILDFATDPTLSEIEYHNKLYDDIIKQRQDLAKDYKFSSDRWMPVQQSIDEYNQSGKVGKFTPPELMPYYDYSKDKKDALKTLKPFITSEIMQTPDGQFAYVNKLSTITTDEAAARILSGYSKLALDQMNSELTAGLGRAPSQQEFNEYVVNDALGSVSGVSKNGIEYYQYGQEITNLTKIGDKVETAKSTKPTEVDPTKADNIYSAIVTRSAPLYTVNEWALNPDHNIEAQIQTKLNDMQVALDGKKEAFKKRFRESYGDGQTIPDYIDVETGQIATAEAQTYLDDINAQEDELTYANSIRSTIKDEAYKEIASKYNSSVLSALDGYIKDDGSSNAYQDAYNKAYNEVMQNGTDPANNHKPIETSLLKEMMKTNRLKKFAEDSADAYAKSKLNDDPIVKEYNKLIEQKLKDKFIYESTFGNAYAFNVVDPDYKALRETLLTTSLDGWKIHQNSTGTQIDNFQSSYMADNDFNYFNLQGYYYNPALKKIVGFGQLRQLKDKKDWVPNSDETSYLNWEDRPKKGDKEKIYNDYYTIEIDSLNNSVMKSIFGEGASAIEGTMNYIQSSIQNDPSGMTRIPVDIYDELDSGHYRTDVIVKDLKNGQYSMTYYDKTNKKYDSVVAPIDQIANALYQFNLDNYNLINQDLDKRKTTVASLIAGTMKDYSTDLQAELLTTIGFETGADPKYKYTTKAMNPTSNAVGFIQFMPDAGQTYKTIGGVQVPMDEIAKASPSRSMQFVKSYIDQYKTDIQSWRERNDNAFGAVYLAVFLPSLLKYDLNTKLSTVSDWDSKYKPANPAFASAETIADLLYIVKNNAGSFK